VIDLGHDEDGNDYPPNQRENSSSISLNTIFFIYFSVYITVTKVVEGSGGSGGVRVRVGGLASRLVRAGTGTGAGTGTHVFHHDAQVMSRDDKRVNSERVRE
jgi:hypothetical protein